MRRTDTPLWRLLLGGVLMGWGFALLVTAAIGFVTWSRVYMEWAYDFLFRLFTLVGVILAIALWNDQRQKRKQE